MSSSRTPPPPVLSVRALNRATLARQLLLGRVRLPVEEAVRRLAGMQAQAPADPYTALWSRLEDFDAAELEALLTGRRVARSLLMRGTIHLATAADTLAWRPLVQPVMDRAQRSNFGRRLDGADVPALLALAERLLTESPLDFARLRKRLGPAWEGSDPEALTGTISYLLPLVQVPPRGLFSRGGPAAWTTAGAWLGPPPGEVPPLSATVLRYLAAFGPASVADFQAWSGLTRTAPAFDSLRPSLATFTDEEGRELFDLPDAPRPGADTAAPPRFLPQYDNLLLAHADRSRVIPAAARARIARANGLERTVLVDGFVAGTWRLSREKRLARIEVRPFGPLPADTRAAVTAEATALLAFLAADAEANEVVITEGV